MWPPSCQAAIFPEHENPVTGQVGVTAADCEGAKPPWFFTDARKSCRSIALLLWGMHMVQSGVQRAFGIKLATSWVAPLTIGSKPFSRDWASPRSCKAATLAGFMGRGFAAFLWFFNRSQSRSH